jgi:rRNA maturation RNase YbeY
MTPFIHFTHQGEEVNPDETLFNWSQRIIQHLPYSIETITFIHCSDDELLEINRQYLDHDYYTDIITFDNSEKMGELEGDIFVSVDRVRENALTLKVEEGTELTRVLAHGLLHLMGYKDKTKEEASLMRSKEEEAIELYRIN